MRSELFPSCYLPCVVWYISLHMVVSKEEFTDFNLLPENESLNDFGELEPGSSLTACQRRQ